MGTNANDVKTAKINAESAAQQIESINAVQLKTLLAQEKADALNANREREQMESNERIAALSHLLALKTSNNSTEATKFVIEQLNNNDYFDKFFVPTTSTGPQVYAGYKK